MSAWKLQPTSRGVERDLERIKRHDGGHEPNRWFPFCLFSHFWIKDCGFLYACGLPWHATPQWKETKKKRSKGRVHGPVFDGSDKREILNGSEKHKLKVGRNKQWIMKEMEGDCFHFCFLYLTHQWFLITQNYKCCISNLWEHLDLPKSDKNMTSLAFKTIQLIIITHIQIKNIFYKYNKRKNTMILEDASFYCSYFSQTILGKCKLQLSMYRVI